jgi:hypothetical protein
MCYAYKKQRRVICLLNKSPNLIDRKKMFKWRKLPAPEWNSGEKKFLLNLCTLKY